MLHVLWSGRIGGIERQVEAIARFAARHCPGQHRVCFLGGQGVVGDALVDEGLADRLDLRGGWDIVGLVRLARLLRRLRPRVVHSHTHALLPTLVLRLALPGAALVYTEQSPRALALDRKFLLLYRLLGNTVSRFIALTPGLARAMEAQGVERDRIAVIPNVFQIPQRAAPGEHAGPPVIGIVARIEPQKRVDLLIDVVAALHRDGIACRGLVVGAGSRLPSLVRQATNAGIGDAVEFAGEQGQVAPWLDRMDVFLMTSAVEPFGITALEAMARGVPVMAMPCPGGLAELAARGGMLLPDREIATAAAAVAELTRSTGRRAELRARGAATVAEHTVERVFPMLERVYLEVAGR